MTMSYHVDRFPPRGGEIEVSEDKLRQAWGAIWNCGRNPGGQFLRDEMIVSCKIEGIPESSPEVESAVQAYELGAAMLTEWPLVERVIRTAHEVLMDTPHGRSKTPGEYRLSQNWIGPPTGRIQDAVYLPPGPEEIPYLMGNLERYINDYDDRKIDPLARLAVIHGEFEAVHPFLDGNGRIGRMLVGWYIQKRYHVKGFGISSYLAKNEDRYRSALNGLNKDWSPLVNLFVEGCIHEGQRRSRGPVKRRGVSRSL